jgi:FtsZ-binding cell division protein ZapB
MEQETRGLGDNIKTVDYFQVEIDRLAKDYPNIQPEVEKLLGETKQITAIADDTVKETVKGLMKRLRAYVKRCDGYHELEKAPPYERGRGVDSFFFTLIDKMARRDKRAKPGEYDRLGDLLTAYDTRKLAEEQERRRKEAEETARKAREAEAVRLKAEREAAEARQKAERARLEATKAAKTEAAVQAAYTAANTRVEATVAVAAATEAHIATLATPADIMRHRGDEGLSSMGTEPFAEITDRNVLDLEKLRPYISMDALQKALNAYARSVDHSSDESVQIKGAKFGKRNKSRVY